MATKIIINICHGGFGISLECARRMASNGCEEAQQMLDRHNSSNNVEFYEQYEGTRHNPHLVEAVEFLEYDAWGECAELEVHEFDGDRYHIREYDGFEEVLGPDDFEWTYVYR
jgi:hypothetical protein